MIEEMTGVNRAPDHLGGYAALQLLQVTDDTTCLAGHVGGEEHGHLCAKSRQHVSLATDHVATETTQKMPQ
jgi:hypothetical protein